VSTVKPPQPSWVAHLVLPPASVASALAQVAPGGRYPLRYAHSKSYLYDAHLILPPAGGVARALPHVAPRGAARGPGAARPGLCIRECRARLFRRRSRQPPQLGGVVCDLAVCDLAELEARCRAGCRAGTGAVFCRRRVGYVQAGGGGREGGGVGQRPRLGAGAVPQRRQALGDALRCKSHTTSRINTILSRLQASVAQHAIRDRVWAAKATRAIWQHQQGGRVRGHLRDAPRQRQLLWLRRGVLGRHGCLQRSCTSQQSQQGQACSPVYHPHVRTQQLGATL